MVALTLNGLENHGMGVGKCLKSFCASVSPPENGTSHTNLPPLMYCEDYRITLFKGKKIIVFHLLSLG